MDLVDYTSAKANGEILNWEYEKPAHNISPTEAIKFAIGIHKKYVLQRQSFDEVASRENLLQCGDIKFFAQPDCFPKLFLLSTSDAMSLSSMEKMYEMANIREKINNGEITEKEGELFALEFSARAKSNK